VLALAFVTVAGLYAAGPATKSRTCETESVDSSGGGYGGYGPQNDSMLRPKSSGDTQTFCTSKRTNAFERIKGAITGNP
jgi:hypothetical protein